MFAIPMRFTILQNTLQITTTPMLIPSGAKTEPFGGLDGLIPLVS